jgi:hypothetical protein
MFAQKLSVTVTTDGSQNATAYTDPIAYGVLSQIKYVKTDFANGVDFTITSEATGETIWAQLNVNADATVCPRQATHGTDGVASLYAGSGQAVLAPIALANDRIKIVIAQGGASKTGTFHFELI